MSTAHNTPQTPMFERMSGKLSHWFGWHINTELDYSELAKEGVNPDIIVALQKRGFTKEELKWVIAPRTLSHRVKNREHLTRDESAKAIRVAKLTAQAETVFANTDKAQRWLSKPKKKLNGATPKEAMQDEFGAGLVEQMLKQIDSGYF